MRSRLLLVMAGVGVLSAAAVAATTYEYDALGRVTKATYDDGSYVQYQYDAAGNRTTVTTTVATSPPPPPPPPPPPTCNGFSFAGYCYYRSDASASCDAVCGSHGGCNLPGTQHIGSSGTLEDCGTVGSVLGFYSPDDIVDDSGQAIGCVWKPGGIVARYASPTTTCSATMTYASRFCACNS
jgi:YD repeat-containing protein